MKIISLTNVSKKFEVRNKERSFLDILNKAKNYEIVALKNINLEVNEGEFIGIIGENGSGKSTLLEIIAGILQPTKGEIKVQGNIAPFIELGVGLESEFTGIENIYLYSSIIGVPKYIIKDRINDILKFSELEEFANMKLKYYSSGMQLRLAFSTAIYSNPDIFLIDEVFNVGDEYFQRKCIKKIAELKRRNKTLLVVSHDLNLIERFCDKVILLKNGEIKDEGKPKQIISKYLDYIDYKEIKELIELNKLKEDLTKKEFMLIEKFNELEVRQSLVNNKLNEVSHKELLINQNLYDLDFKQSFLKEKMDESTVKELELNKRTEGISIREYNLNKIIDEIKYEAKKHLPAIINKNSIIEIKNVRLLNNNKSTKNFKFGDTLIIEIEYYAKKPIENPVFGIAIFSKDDIWITGPNTNAINSFANIVEGQGVVKYSINSLPLLAGEYSITASIYDMDEKICFDFKDRIIKFKVEGSNEKYGFISLNGEWKHERK